ncbi:polysaccharide deacetylase family protein [Candidatus Minimicrobia naudis]|uniref:Polysaccharide deacetylase family protein n=1 Tax=Candidatus Minimicrobia naudis TaxID=2841263 RepID=A0A8F1SBR9_9BACT|nr:polysaccharide deacetylase family protein [Candidatus Minimicrobia naudis]
MDLNETINKETLSNFIITNNGNSLTWPIGQASLLPSTYGEMTIKVQIPPRRQISAKPNSQENKPISQSLPGQPKPQTKPAPAAPTTAPNTGNKVIALTFDDRPGPYTAHLLDILDQHGAKGPPFFLIGSKVSSQANVVRSIHARGHQLGNHSWSHPELPKLPVDQIAGEIDRTNEAIRQATGVKPSILRPPYGAVNGIVLEQIRLHARICHQSCGQSTRGTGLIPQ